MKQINDKNLNVDKIIFTNILELRIMGGSDVLMASQYGNKHGTLAIEPVSTRSAIFLNKSI